MTDNYKIIDIHAHIFPDKVAAKAVSAISNYYGVPMAGAGTVDDLLEKGSAIGVDEYVVHSCATDVHQVAAINDYVSEVQKSSDRFIGFGTLHPGLSEPQKEVERIISLGLRGIKLHPEFQRFVLDADEMMPVYKAIEGRLPLLIHMGDENTDSSSPKRLARILDMFPDIVVIAAHFGGYRAWSEALEYLVGRNLYMDTSSSLYFLEPSQAVYMIRKHGVNKFLFGSDYPMWNHEEELERFLKLDINEKERACILYENANKLLSFRNDLTPADVF